LTFSKNLNGFPVISDAHCGGNYQEDNV